MSNSPGAWPIDKAQATSLCYPYADFWSIPRSSAAVREWLFPVAETPYLVPPQRSAAEPAAVSATFRCDAIGCADPGPAIGAFALQRSTTVLIPHAPLPDGLTIGYAITETTTGGPVSKQAATHVARYVERAESAELLIMYSTSPEACLHMQRRVRIAPGIYMNDYIVAFPATPRQASPVSASPAELPEPLYIRSRTTGIYRARDPVGASAHDAMALLAAPSSLTEQCVLGVCDWDPVPMPGGFIASMPQAPSPQPHPSECWWGAAPPHLRCCSKPTFVLSEVSELEKCRLRDHLVLKLRHYGASSTPLPPATGNTLAPIPAPALVETVKAEDIYESAEEILAVVSSEGDAAMVAHSPCPVGATSSHRRNPAIDLHLQQFQADTSCRASCTSSSATILDNTDWTRHVGSSQGSVQNKPVAISHGYQPSFDSLQQQSHKESRESSVQQLMNLKIGSLSPVLEQPLSARGEDIESSSSGAGPAAEILALIPQMPSPVAAPAASPPGVSPIAEIFSAEAAIAPAPGPIPAGPTSVPLGSQPGRQIIQENPTMVKSGRVIRGGRRGSPPSPSEIVMRNRISAQKSNEKRRLRIEGWRKELDRLKKVVLPQLKLTETALLNENRQVRLALSQRYGNSLVSLESMF